MLRHGDTLDHKVLNVMNLVLKELPTDEGPAQFEHEDIKELLLGLPSVEVFLPIPLAFRLLRRALELYGISLVTAPPYLLCN